ncbi:MAG: peptidoglycan DD-metalloendopeptidase family protein [Cyanobacteria bacterium RM1_2_2]|nr:peptidoglycan DD-metalloendopeptidase family protein [Cyanobacteria bacterium RM1_2_2]
MLELLLATSVRRSSRLIHWLMHRLIHQFRRLKLLPAPVPSLKNNWCSRFCARIRTNLASRLARLSQNQNASPTATAVTPVASSAPQLVAPELFVGVAASTVPSQTQPIATARSVATQPTAIQPKTGLSQATEPKVAESKVIQPQVIQPQVTQPQVTQPKPVLAASAQINKVQISTAQISTAQDERQFAEQLFPSQLPTPTPTVAPIGATATANLTTRPTEILHTSSDRQVSLPLSDDFQPFGFTFSKLLDKPLDWVWNWWNVPTPQAQAEQLSGGLPSRSQPQISSTIALPLTAEVGLANSPLLQTIEQDLTTVLQPLRNARKLSISLPSTKNVSLKAPLKAPDYDSSALLAFRCSRAQLAQSRVTNALINPATAKQLGWVNFMFPLPIPAVITSAFGWRTHPISGDLRFHTGLDIGAPMGTPVLSATKGQVTVAEAMGGYGLTVVVENESTHQRKLYAHLSGIAVQPGAVVEPGAVLGWVGSTGNSTGPHLHFESQIKTENGWSVIDPLASAAVAIAQEQD